MDVEKTLTDRFTRAIRKSFHPCPLIGPKWFRHNPDGTPADFQFLGTRKLAKATGRKPAQIANMIVRNLNLHGIDGRVKITGSFNIHVKLSQGKDGD